MKKIVVTDQAPAAIGPYSQAVIAGNLIFTAGQIALSPQTGEFTARDVTGQTKQVLDNLNEVLKAAGTDLAHVVKTTVYLTAPDHFKPMNEIYMKYFTDNPPARSAVFVQSLPKNALVEIDAIARL
ncbi:RidA family protein [candidate division WOR-3 bacterium]|nr:RidA family protein [candidate division WOR-3 bacterium]